MIIYIDIDNTICRTNGTDYENAVPDTTAIHRVNILFHRKHRIVYWTSRGVGSGKDLRLMTEQQLKKWGCLYHEFRCDKPVYDLFIDDKTLNNISLVNTLHPDIYLSDINKNVFMNQNYSENQNCSEDKKCKLRLKQAFKYPILDIYKDKKICLLGCGSSLEKYNINFDNYDLVVGINRIHLTEYWPYINILYYNLSKKDEFNLPHLLNRIQNSKHMKHLFFCPWSSSRQKKLKLRTLIRKYNIVNHTYCKTIVKQIPNIKKRPLTGVAALNHILLCTTKTIDIYGFDFYQNNYINKLQYYSAHEKYHDIGSNFDFFKTLLETHNDKIVWHQ